MQVPLQIKFHYMEPSPVIEDRVRERCHKLQRFAEHVTRCRVIINAPHKPQDKTRSFQVSLELTLPDEQTGTAYRSELHHEHKDVDIAIREVFAAAQHQLENYVRQQRAYMKTKGPRSHSHIA